MNIPGRPILRPSRRKRRIEVLTKRRNWVQGRINAAHSSSKADLSFDKAEASALTWAIQELETFYADAGLESEPKLCTQEQRELLYELLPQLTSPAKLALFLLLKDCNDIPVYLEKIRKLQDELAEVKNQRNLAYAANARMNTELTQEGESIE